MDQNQDKVPEGNLDKGFSALYLIVLGFLLVQLAIYFILTLNLK